MVQQRNFPAGLDFVLVADKCVVFFKSKDSIPKIYHSANIEMRIYIDVQYTDTGNIGIESNISTFPIFTEIF